jgi:hypothetical protein
MIGDVIGQPGLKALFAGLGPLVRSTRADIVIANGENAMGGFGIGKEEADRLFSIGVQVITTGNHVWERPGSAELLAATPRLLRPSNYPPGAAGTGTAILEAGGAAWAVLNLQGREDMTPIDCPFRGADAALAAIEAEAPGAIVLVDFHAESVEEKEALGFYLDGRVAAMAGTHTHVQTADERVFPNGTAYITDAGMTGPHESIIGTERQPALARFLTGMPSRFEPATGDPRLNGVVIAADDETGKATSITRLSCTMADLERMDKETAIE